MLIPDTIREESDSDYGGMLSIGNSEIGERRISSMPSIFRAICMNGCIWDQTAGKGINQVHRGKIDLDQLFLVIKENLEVQIPLLPQGIERLLGTRRMAEKNSFLFASTGVRPTESDYSMKSRNMIQQDICPGTVLLIRVGNCDKPVFKNVRYVRSMPNGDDETILVVNTRNRKGEWSMQDTTVCSGSIVNRCEVCKTNTTNRNLEEKNGVVYCTQCYMKAFPATAEQIESMVRSAWDVPPFSVERADPPYAWKIAFARGPEHRLLSEVHSHILKDINSSCFARVRERSLEEPQND